LVSSGAEPRQRLRGATTAPTDEHGHADPPQRHAEPAQLEHAVLLAVGADRDEDAGVAKTAGNPPSGVPAELHLQPSRELEDEPLGERELAAQAALDSRGEQVREEREGEQPLRVAQSDTLGLCEVDDGRPAVADELENDVRRWSALVVG
jgi:hypothetical protein